MIQLDLWKTHGGEYQGEKRLKRKTEKKVMGYFGFQDFLRKNASDFLKKVFTQIML